MFILKHLLVSRKHLLISIIKLETIKMSEPSVNIVKLAVGVKSVEELALIPVSYTHLTLPTSSVV